MLYKYISEYLIASDKQDYFEGHDYRSLRENVKKLKLGKRSSRKFGKNTAKEQKILKLKYYPIEMKLV